MYYRKSALQYLNTDIHRLGGYPLWLCFRCLPGLTVAALVMMLLSVNSAQAQPGDDVIPNGVQAGQLLFQERQGGRFTPAVIQDSKVHFDISGMIARVRLEQTFHNGSDQWVEAVYAFPLPDTGAVRAMEMRVGERRIVGEIKEKSLAKKIYEKAKTAGKKASLVEQQRPNLFTNRVANIGPGEDVIVKLEYIQQVEYRAGEFFLRFPMTITPRYIPGNLQPSPESAAAHESVELNPYLGWAAPTDQVPDANAITPLVYPNTLSGGAPYNSIEVTAQLDVGMPLAKVESPYHELAMSRSKNRYDIRLAQGFSEMNRDFVLSWQAVTGAAPQAAVFTEKVAGEYYGLLMVIPPALVSADSLSRLPREIVFIIDTSGSMGGVAIAQARESLSLALRELRPQDSFNVIEFNSSHRLLFQQAVPASQHNVQRAQEFVRQLDAGGGTEMLPALRAALTLSGNAGQEERGKLRQVVFITDGAVGNEQQLYTEITQQLGENRLFTVGIGSAPNSWFMRKAAQFGRGAHIHIGDLAEVGEKMARLFDQISSPVAANITIDWPTAVESFPQRVPDLYKGEPVVVAVKSGASALQGKILVKGDLAGQAWSRELELSGEAYGDSGSGGRHAGVASLWAGRKISALLDGLVTGQPKAQVRTAVLDVALTHSLMSPYTSFVAVEERLSRPANTGLSKTPVPNSQPKGQSPQGFAYPRTATTASANVFLGSLLMFLSMMVMVMRREEVDHVPAHNV
ncbi:MAG: marine proteobacterial sortase target protein [Halioglobus sp.]